MNSLAKILHFLRQHIPPAEASQLFCPLELPILLFNPRPVPCSLLYPNLPCIRTFVGAHLRLPKPALYQDSPIAPTLRCASLHASCPAAPPAPSAAPAPQDGALIPAPCSAPSPAFSKFSSPLVASAFLRISCLSFACARLCACDCQRRLCVHPCFGCRTG